MFAYCVPRRKHGEMLEVMTELAGIYGRHGGLGMRLYVWGKTTVFQGFAGLHDKLGAGPDDELWLEVDSYRDAPGLTRVVESVGRDSEARTLWERLTRLVGPGKSIAMGEFERLRL